MAVLQVFVDGDCAASRRALHLVAQAQARFPELQVHVVDISTPGAVHPDEVFAVPTYLIDGHLLSLGNPRPSALLSVLAARLSDVMGDRS